MRCRVALNDEPLPAAVCVMPQFLVNALRVVAEIDVVEPRLHIGRPVRRAHLGGIARIGEFTVVARAAKGTVNPDHRPLLLRPGEGAGPLLLNEVAA